MRGVCLLDTSVVLEMLRVPGKSGTLPDVDAELRARQARADLVLPLATVVETGNHIGQCSGDRHRLASAFAGLVQRSLEGKAPFTVHPFPDDDAWEEILTRFPEWAAGGSGLGDLTIVHACEQLRARFPHRTVEIWSLDEHLGAWGDAGG